MYLRTCIAGAALVATLGLASVASATTVTVFPGDPSWVEGGSTGGGASAITAASPRSGAGSLELHGDRTRFFHGNPFDANSNFGLLSDVDSLTFDWQIALDSTSNLDVDATPALRLHIFDNGVRSELIWEGAYNGTYGNTTHGSWYSTGANDKFWRYVSGLGLTLDGGAQVNLSIADWTTGASSSSTQWYSDSAYVSAISVGVGSSIGSGYHAFADNVTLALGGASTTYNFEVTRVPEPGIIALFGFGLIALGLSRRRR